MSPLGVPPAVAAELAALRREVAGLGRLHVTPPLTIVRGPDGGASIGLDALGPGRAKRIGKLDGTLSFGGSAVMSVWRWNGTAYADTLENITVYDWLLSSGQTIAAGRQVTAFFDPSSGRWFVDGAQCS